MDYIKLGRTGLEVSRLCLGCMAFGTPGEGMHSWALDDTGSRPLLKKALDMGINFFDTANAYSSGVSEEIVGRALKTYANRDNVVIATKVFLRMRPGPNGGGLSRKVIMAEIDHSLKRLGTDRVDLYQIHRWDYATPIEETLEALHDVVKAGKALHIGASSMYAWQFAKALACSDRHGWTRFQTMQNHVNLLYREEEREMLPLCRDQGIGVIPWSPLARGILTRPWGEATHRTEHDEIGKALYARTADSDRQVVDAVGAVAEARGIPRAQIALAWVLGRSDIAAPIIGATREGHLNDAQAALAIKLDAAEIAALEAPYIPHPVLGFS